MSGPFIMAVTAKVFPHGKLQQDYSLAFNDEGEAINCYEATVNSILTLQARIVNSDTGIILRRFKRGI